MSDRPIQVGDVVLILGCLNKSMVCHIGKVGRALDNGGVFGPDHWLVEGAIRALDGTEGWWHSRRLKRLDPDALKDDVPTREELTA